MRTAKDYLELLKNLLPRGEIWTVQRDSNFEKFLLAKADELARLDAENYRFIKEVNPLYSLEMLEDWERVLGLPDECMGQEQTLEVRRALVLRKLIRGQNFNRKYILEICKIFGYEDAYIEDFTPFLVNVSSVGDALNDAPGGANLDSKKEPPQWVVDAHAGWRFTFLLHLGKSKIRYFKTGDSQVGDRLATWGDKVIECIINRDKPAHIIILFGYEIENTDKTK